MRSLTKKEIERRRPVWSALSDVFLDTEVRPSIPYAALACLDSGYSSKDLDSIWVHEISPVLMPNMYHPAGEWAVFDQNGSSERS